MYYLSLHLASLTISTPPSHYYFLIEIPLTSTMLVGIKVLAWVDSMHADEVQLTKQNTESSGLKISGQ